ncbi:MAG: leucine-rich repeat domain-containing protein, partial [Clostridia bacterium]|nr:leucine-rich repeat domain-containing protein [Clostridia bacterium]
CCAFFLTAQADESGVLILPEETRIIESEAFAGMEAVKEIRLPATVTQIGAGAFRDTGESSAPLRYYFPPEGLTAAPGAFDGCRATVKVNGAEMPRLTYTVAENGVTITGSSGNLTDVVIPDTLEGKPVVAIGSNAFNGRSAMTSVAIPSTVTSLGAGAFRNCSSLTQITLPAGITALPNSVFQGDQRLQQVTLQGTLTAIGNDAFNDCYVLAFDIPATVTQIGSNAFRYCRALTQATVPSGVRALSESVFAHCENLQSVTLPQGMESIGYAAFDCCYALAGVSLPDTVTTLGNSVFYNCRALTSVTLPSGVTALPNEAFRGCSALAQVNLPAGLASMGSNVFNGCSALTSVSLPAGITALPNEAFNNANGLRTVQLPSGLATLGTNVFRDCQALTSVTLPAGITALPSNTFYNCYALAQVSLPAGLTSLGADTFYNCRALTAIDLPAGVTALPNEAFYGCSALAAIDLTGITSLGTGALRACASLTEVTIPEDVTALPSSLFEESTGLTQVHLPSTLTTINNYAFYHCRALTEISIPAGVTAIPYGAFTGCSALQRVTLPAGLESIAQNAFRECTKLTQINFPAGLTSIGQEAFRDSCVGQSTNAVYVLPDSVETFGTNAFYNCGAGLLVTKGSNLETVAKTNGYLFTYDADTGFRYQYKSNTLYLAGYKGQGGNVTIPAEATVIGERAFYENTAITGITIPTGFVTIDTSAFVRCTNLSRVTMADTITTIKNNAFYGCANLTDVTFSANLTSIGQDAFDYACTVAGTYFYRLPDHITTLDWTPFNDCGAVPCFNRGSDTAALFRSDNNTRSIQYTYTGETDFRYLWYSSEGEHLMQYTGSAATVNIPPYVWLIDDGAFRDNTTITKVIIPEGVTRINSNAFRDCVHLTDVTFPSTLDTLWNNAFNGCGSAAQASFCFNLPDNINEVAPDVFVNCPAILTCGIDSTTASKISNPGWSFARNDRPDELDFRYKYDYFDHVWGWGLYDYAGSLTSVLLPDDCANVSSAVLRQKVNDGLELKCNQLSDTALGLSNANVPFTFPGHEGLRYRIINNVLYVTGCVGSPTELVIPQVTAYINAGWEERIDDRSFANLTTLTKLVLPEGMYGVGDSAFRGCVNLTDITFPDSLKVLDNHAFEQCGKNADYLHYYVLPDNMTSISTNTDAGWGAFTDINKGRISCNPDTTTALQLSAIDIYNHGGSYRFALKGHETDGLLYQYRQYTVDGEPVNRLELRAYEGSGTSVTIPAGVGLYRIEDDVFKDCQELEQVTIPDGVVEIGSYAFSGCTMLHGGAEEFVIRVPSTVKRLQNNAFFNAGSGYYAERFYLVLPAGLEEFDISVVTGCNAVFVAPGGLAAQVLYNNWYYYYLTLADAMNGIDCQYRREYNDQGIEITHSPRFGKR